ncbi:hypothetical protein FVE85_2506 [Porphyridium purpureum]|uniref:Trafficking protein particle complex subunit 8 n=1 Tax=Porphyridium purpureum TaxID=35688 RepID=A0A5J4YJ68_PORPP|nr:hypothetical protein FVE85_2506 [Porphyridium purpureum]|eukprot:POR0692..scf291_13
MDDGHGIRVAARRVRVLVRSTPACDLLVREASGGRWTSLGRALQHRQLEQQCGENKLTPRRHEALREHGATEGSARTPVQSVSSMDAGGMTLLHQEKGELGEDRHGTIPRAAFEIDAPLSPQPLPRKAIALAAKSNHLQGGSSSPNPPVQDFRPRPAAPAFGVTYATIRDLHDEDPDHQLAGVRLRDEISEWTSTSARSVGRSFEDLSVQADAKQQAARVFHALASALQTQTDKNHIEPLNQPLAVVVAAWVGETNLVSSLNALLTPPLAELPASYSQNLYSLSSAARFVFLIQRDSSIEENERALRALAKVNAEVNCTNMHVAILGRKEQNMEGDDEPVAKVGKSEATHSAAFERALGEAVDAVIVRWTREEVDAKCSQLLAYADRVRKGVKNTLKSWFRSSDKTRNGIVLTTSGDVRFLYDSVEFKLHFLADLLYMQGAYEPALSHYRLVAQDYKANRAALPGAYASLMCAHTLLLLPASSRREVAACLESAIEAFLESAHVAGASLAVLQLARFYALHERHELAKACVLRFLSHITNEGGPGVSSQTGPDSARAVPSAPSSMPAKSRSPHGTFRHSLLEEIAIGILMYRCAELHVCDSTGSKSESNGSSLAGRRSYMRKARLYTLFAAERLKVLGIVDFAQHLFGLIYCDLDARDSRGQEAQPQKHSRSLQFAMSWAEAKDEVLLSMCELELAKTPLSRQDASFVLRSISDILGTLKNSARMNRRSSSSMVPRFQDRLFLCLCKAVLALSASKIQTRATKEEQDCDGWEEDYVDFPLVADAGAMVRTLDSRRQISEISSTASGTTTLNSATVLRDEEGYWRSLDAELLERGAPLILSRKESEGAVPNNSTRPSFVKQLIMHVGDVKIGPERLERHSILNANSARDDALFTAVGETVRLSYTWNNVLSFPVHACNLRIVLSCARSDSNVRTLRVAPQPQGDMNKAVEYLIMPHTAVDVELSFVVETQGHVQVIGVTWDFFVDTAIPQTASSIETGLPAVSVVEVADGSDVSADSNRVVRPCGFPASLHVPGAHVFRKVGRRLNDTREQRRSETPVRWPDRSLNLIVLPQLGAVTCDIHMLPFIGAPASSERYAGRFREGQYVRAMLQVTNAGSVPLPAIALMLDRNLERNVCIHTTASDTKTDSGVFLLDALKPYETRQMELTLRMPQRKDERLKGTAGTAVIGTQKPYAGQSQVGSNGELSTVVRLSLLYLGLGGDSDPGTPGPGPVWRIARASRQFVVRRCLNVFLRYARRDVTTVTNTTTTTTTSTATDSKALGHGSASAATSLVQNKAHVLGVEVEHCWREAAEVYDIPAVFIGSPRICDGWLLERVPKPTQLESVGNTVDTAAAPGPMKHAISSLMRARSKGQHLKLRVNETGTLFVRLMRDESSPRLGDQVHGFCAETESGVQWLNLSTLHNETSEKDKDLQLDDARQYFAHVLGKRGGAYSFGLFVCWEHRASGARGDLVVPLGPSIWDEKIEGGLGSAVAPEPLREASRLHHQDEKIGPTKAVGVSVAYRLGGAASVVPLAGAPERSAVVVPVDVCIRNTTSRVMDLQAVRTGLMGVQSGSAVGGELKTTLRFLAPGCERIVRVVCTLFSHGPHRAEFLGTELHAMDERGQRYALLPRNLVSDPGFSIQVVDFSSAAVTVSPLVS